MADLRAKIDEVLVAFELLLNESMALDYCGVTGKDRKLILNNPDFTREAKRIKAGKYIEEIKDINALVQSLGQSGHGENERFSESDEDPTKIIALKMKVASMRREMLSLSASEKETDEAESLNIFFIDVDREEFEKMLNVELQEGDAFATLSSDEGKDTPVDADARYKKEEKKKTSIPSELSRNTIEYVNENGEKVIEEVIQ